MKIDLSPANENQREKTTLATTRALIQFDTNFPSFSLDPSIAIESYESRC